MPRARSRFVHPGLLLAAALGLLASVACGEEESPGPSVTSPSTPAGAGGDAGLPLGGEELNAAADDYVRLVLAAGRHDPQYVDAYYGPPEWRQEADSGAPVAIPELLGRTHELLTRVAQAPDSARRRSLERQVTALEGFLRLEGGEKKTLAEEAAMLFDIEPAAVPMEELERLRHQVDAVVPGEGELSARVAAYRARFAVPRSKARDFIGAVLQETQKRTAAAVALPRGEGVALNLVQGKSWGAYNWYQGQLKSRIEVSTDLPLELHRLFHTLAHEAYPGHHVYNALLEDRLVRGRGWREFVVYPLHSPQSILAEGSAQVGLDAIIPRDQQIAFARDVLAPLCGIDPAEIARYWDVVDAVEALRHATPEATRMVVDEGKSEEEAIAFLVRYALVDRDRARKSIAFGKEYRSYVYTYPVGHDLVQAYVGAGLDREQRFFEILQKPVTPSELRQAVATERAP
jgi:hypothetical protein